MANLDDPKSFNKEGTNDAEKDGKDSVKEVDNPLSVSMTTAKVLLEREESGMPSNQS